VGKVKSSSMGCSSSSRWWWFVWLSIDL
jgi:hypothetical protein